MSPSYQISWGSTPWNSAGTWQDFTLRKQFSAAFTVSSSRELPLSINESLCHARRTLGGSLALGSIRLPTGLAPLTSECWDVTSKHHRI